MVWLFLIVFAPHAAAEDAIFEDDFEQEASGTNWSAVLLGGVEGAGTASYGDFSGGRLTLYADEDTERWIGVAHDVTCAGCNAVRISATVDARNVDDVGSFGVRAALFALVEGPEGREFRFSMDAAGRGPVRLNRRIVLGQGEALIQAGVALLAPGQVVVDDFRVDEESQSWAATAAGPITFMTLHGGAGVSRRDRSWTLSRMRKNARWLGVRPLPRVRLWVYPDLGAKIEWTGDPANAHIIGSDIHTIWSSDEHEVVHALARAWGSPPAFFREGLAVYRSSQWHGSDVRSYAARCGSAPTRLNHLLDDQYFSAQNDSIIYATAGAFIEWFVQQYGRVALRAVYGTLSSDVTSAENVTVIEGMIGSSSNEIEQGFSDWLDRTPRDESVDCDSE